jgi:hypothetical protein
MESSRRLQWGKESAETQTRDDRNELKLLWSMMSNVVGVSSQSILQGLQTDRATLSDERDAAVGYALMI